jgi:hypothetical protein
VTRVKARMAAEVEAVVAAVAVVQGGEGELVMGVEELWGHALVEMPADRVVRAPLPRSVGWGHSATRLAIGTAPNQLPTTPPT